MKRPGISWTKNDGNPGVYTYDFRRGVVTHNSNISLTVRP